MYAILTLIGSKMKQPGRPEAIDTSLFVFSQDLLVALCMIREPDGIGITRIRGGLEIRILSEDDGTRAVAEASRTLGIDIF